MSKIRSIHQEMMHSDEVVACTPVARLLYLGLLTEADDNGAFAWRPQQLRFAIFPGDYESCGWLEGLLEELVLNGLIKRYSISGQEYGLIHLFRKYQSPKKSHGKYPPPFIQQAGKKEEISREDTALFLFGTTGKPLTKTGRSCPIWYRANEPVEYEEVISS